VASPTPHERAPEIFDRGCEMRNGLIFARVRSRSRSTLRRGVAKGPAKSQLRAVHSRLTGVWAESALSRYAENAPKPPGPVSKSEDGAHSLR